MKMLSLILALITMPAAAQLRPGEVEMLKQIEARDAAEAHAREAARAAQAREDSANVQREFRANLKAERCSINPYWPDCSK